MEEMLMISQQNELLEKNSPGVKNIAEVEPIRITRFPGQEKDRKGLIILVCSGEQDVLR
jgi:hypothetical protein